MKPELIRERTARIQKLNKALTKLFPKVGIELVYSNPLELLIAVQLSAQCTDKMVNKITATLFVKYKTLRDYLLADPRVFEKDIRSSGFFRAKTKNILGAVRMIEKEFGGEVPQTITQLLRLPGVARKTATVVLAEAFGVVEGITVDTHVIRFVHRFDLSDSKNPVRIEKDLQVLLPKKEWRDFTHRVIHYGRYIAPARAYDITKDPLVSIYPKAGKRFRTSSPK